MMAEIDAKKAMRAVKFDTPKSVCVTAKPNPVTTTTKEEDDEWVTTGN